MKGMFSFLGRLIGVHFAPDNHVVPVLRLEQFNRVEGSGFFPIIPLLERTLPPVKTSLYIGNFFFEEVLTRDNIPFSIQLTILFTFDPRSARKEAAAMLVRRDENALKLIVKDYTSQGIRRLVSRFRAEDMSREATMSGIRRDLAHLLKGELHALGIAPLPSGGVLLKETVPAEAFRKTMLDAKHDEAILDALGKCPTPELIPQLGQVLLANSLKERSGQLVVMNTPENANRLPLLSRDKVYKSNGNQ